MHSIATMHATLPFLMNHLANGLWVAAAVVLGTTSLCGQQTTPNQAKPQAEAAGAMLKLPEDGSPFHHGGSGVSYPQSLGDFRMLSLFRDKQKASGVCMTYGHPKLDIKGDIVIYPCPTELKSVTDITPVVRKEHQKLLAEIQTPMQKAGYGEKERSPLAEQNISLWDALGIVMTHQTLVLTPVDAKNTQLPGLNLWIGLLLYQDYYLQISVLLPADQVAKLGPVSSELITDILQCVREPALKPKMRTLCANFVKAPFTDASRLGADTLLDVSTKSNTFKVPLPGDAMTAALNEIASRSKDASIDLLRAFVVGSAEAALDNRSVDDCLAQGARYLGASRDRMRDHDINVSSAFFDELDAAVDKGTAAAFLMSRMAPEQTGSGQ
jgi:hypothetical protein